MTGPSRLDRALIGVSGPDARSFLNNLLTQDLDGLDEAGVLYGALLTPQGKLVADMLIWSDGAGVVLETDPARAGDLMRRLGVYKLRAQATIADRSDVCAVFCPRPWPGARADPRFPDGALGYRGLSAEGARLPRDAGDHEALRLAVGVPDLAADARGEEVFAGEALLEELNGVDFHKGCFVGQENVSRMKRRATTRRKFCPVVFDGAPPAYGAPVRAAGVELGQARTGTQGRAIALLRLDRALAAVASGEFLAAEDREVRLDPPSWLILPQREGATD